MRVNALEEVKIKFDGPETNPHAFKALPAGAVRLVADHEVDPLPDKERAGLLDNRCRIFRFSKAIDDRAQSHIAKIAMAAEFRIQQTAPSRSPSLLAEP